MPSTQVPALKPERTIDRHSLDARLLTALTDLRSAQLDHRTACLLHAQAPDDQERAHAVTVLEQEIKQHELTIERLSAAQQADDTGAVERALTDRLDAARKAAQVVAELAPRERAIAERLAGYFESISADLAELASVESERKAQAWSAISNAAGRAALNRYSALFTNLVATNHVRTALLASVVRSGLGRVGPDLAPYVTVSAYANDVGTVEAALDRHARNSGYIDEFLADVIAKATSPQPATSEQE